MTGPRIAHFSLQRSTLFTLQEPIRETVGLHLAYLIGEWVCQDRHTASCSGIQRPAPRLRR